MLVGSSIAVELKSTPNYFRMAVSCETEPSSSTNMPTKVVWSRNSAALSGRAWYDPKAPLRGKWCRGLRIYSDPSRVAVSFKIAKIKVRAPKRKNPLVPIAFSPIAVNDLTPPPDGNTSAAHPSALDSGPVAHQPAPHVWSWKGTTECSLCLGDCVPGDNVPDIPAGPVSTRLHRTRSTWTSGVA